MPRYINCAPDTPTPPPVTPPNCEPTPPACEPAPPANCGPPTSTPPVAGCDPCDSGFSDWSGGSSHHSALISADFGVGGHGGGLLNFGATIGNLLHVNADIGNNHGWGDHGSGDYGWSGHGWGGHSDFGSFIDANIDIGHSFFG
jgi:hypothetical protein